jgi:hypothetical protein
MTDYFNEPVSGTLPIDISSSGDNIIVSMYSFLTSKYPLTDIKSLVDKKIFVTNYFVNCHGCVNIQWKSNSSVLSGPIEIASAGTMIANSANDPAIFWTGKNQDLILNLSESVQVSGHVTFYIK